MQTLSDKKGFSTDIRGMELALFSVFMGEYLMVNTHLHSLSDQDQNEQEREGIVVWDQNGVVVLWPDGHCSRFSWEMLRQSCQCAECQTRQEQLVERGK